MMMMINNSLGLYRPSHGPLSAVHSEYVGHDTSHPIQQCVAPTWVIWVPAPAKTLNTHWLSQWNSSGSGVGELGGLLSGGALGEACLGY